MQSLMMIAKLNPSSGLYDLWEPWRGTVANVSAQSDLSATSTQGRGSNTVLAGAATYQTANQTTVAAPAGVGAQLKAESFQPLA